MNGATSVTVVLPAFNEGASLGMSLAAIAEYLSLHRSYEFRYVIVDDGSSDDTFRVAKDFARWRSNVRVLQHYRNRGVGAALRTAFRDIDSDLVVVLDVDLSYSPMVAMQLIQALDRQGADIALASPYAYGGSVVNLPFIRRLLSRECNRFLSLATAGRFATFTCMVRAYRTTALRQLEFCADGTIAAAEMLLSGLRNRMHIIELPATLRWSDARHSERRQHHVRDLASHSTASLLLACRYRPSLCLAVPGLVPGLLLVVVAVLLILHVSTRALEIGIIATLIVQYAGFALFTGEINGVSARNRRRKDRVTKGVSENGYRLPRRIR
ncbi:MAG TPA: glycosyltransferase family 2 protein [Candidatus Baltobacteraceae bacterium]|nr:glycosyltransferase family 2 protein [Candidatus Baltobacteraceae bacterium]